VEPRFAARSLLSSSIVPIITVGRSRSVPLRYQSKIDLLITVNHGVDRKTPLELPAALDARETAHLLHRGNQLLHAIGDETGNPVFQDFGN
jgi:hypothetical protein